MATTLSLTGTIGSASALSLAPVVTNAVVTNAGNSAPISISFTTAVALSAANGALDDQSVMRHYVSVELQDLDFVLGAYQNCWGTGPCSDFEVSAVDSAQNVIDLSGSNPTLISEWQSAAVGGVNAEVATVGIYLAGDVPAETTFTFVVAAGIIKPLACAVNVSLRAVIRDNWYSGNAAIEDFTSVALEFPTQKSVTFLPNGGSGTSASPDCRSQSTVLTRNPFKKTGYSFTGWNTVASPSVGTPGTAYANAATYPFETDVTLYAQWAATKTPTMTSSDLTPLIGGVNQKPITMKWQATEPLPQQIAAASSQVTFKLTGITSDATTRYAASCSLISDPCYGFVLTSSSGALTGVQRRVTALSSNSVEFTFYLGLNEIPADTTLTLTIPVAVMSLAQSQSLAARTSVLSSALEASSSVTIGAAARRQYLVPTGTAKIANGIFYDSILRPTNPIRTGYRFLGWFLTGTEGTALAFPFKPTGSGIVTMYAQWTEVTYAVTYDVDGGSAVAEGSFNSGGAVTLPAAPTKTGFTFEGWFEGASGGVALVSGFLPSVTVPITVYAQWTAVVTPPNLLVSNTVTFIANGGIGSMASQSNISPAGLSLNDFVRDGSYFVGWNTAANGSGITYANGQSHSFSASEVLFAQWRLIPELPTSALAILAQIGDPIADAPVDIQADGLQDQAPYTVTVYSTARILDQGTIAIGRLNTTVRLPSDLEPGWHRLVINSTAADGSPWSETIYFNISASGTLLATVDALPSEPTVTVALPEGLAITGRGDVPTLVFGLGAFLTGLTVALANRIHRRRVCGISSV
jgi:uncharacterized repeat protein (TIGR02543 family)